MSARDFVPQLVRWSSGVPGLDEILAGGFFAGGVYIVEGAPGAGKTILANQIAFHHVRQGRRVLYITLLAESHARMLQHLQGMSFFEGSAIPDQLTYVSGFSALESGGLKALLELVRKELRAQMAGFVVLDGFAAVGETAATDREFKKFVHELQVHASLASSTFFLLSSGLTDEATVQPVHTMVDGLVRMTDHAFGVRAQREIQLQKFRGSRYLRGVHSFQINDDGIRVHPRLESLSADLADASAEERVGTGVDRLDGMLHGGLRLGSTTMVLGPTGVGKTVLGYSFLSLCSPQQKGLLFSFYETPKGAIEKARGIGLDLKTACEQGNLEIAWQSPVETSLDVIGGRILEAVDRAKVKRAFVDGFNALQSSATYPERVEQFFGALTRELRGRGITTVYAAEIHEVFSPQIQPSMRSVSPLLDSLVLLRFVEVRGRLERVISILKTRDSSFDPEIRAFEITSRGVQLGDTVPDVEGLPTGVVRTRRGSPDWRRRARGPKRRRLRTGG
ncbi:MAG: hypothetical protein JOZ69_20720 [Myxococcales bacterium]|nr:hypothetical protein [Myxococcales bacterium]